VAKCYGYRLVKLAKFGGDVLILKEKLRPDINLNIWKGGNVKVKHNFDTSSPRRKIFVDENRHCLSELSAVGIWKQTRISCSFLSKLQPHCLLSWSKYLDSESDPAELQMACSVAARSSNPIFFTRNEKLNSIIPVMFRIWQRTCPAGRLCRINANHTARSIRKPTFCPIRWRV
jgi:hypothetical protein